MKNPLDLTRYERDSKSQEIRVGIPDGTYVYVQDENQKIFVLPDGPHQHPRVLGNAEPALYAGDLTVLHGKIRDVTNLSGTFQFSDAEGLSNVAARLEKMGFSILPGAVRLFDYESVDRPTILR